jgi:hypothetical protein
MKYSCPCCGNFTLQEKPTGTYYICKVCFWEDDNVQYNNPNLEGGANKVSLNQARQNYADMQVSDVKYADKVREPTLSELPENNF